MSTTRLADLRPKLTGTLADGVLAFNCPLPGHTHRHVVPFAPQAGELDGVKHWQASGVFPDSLTVLPSIDASKTGCWHGFVTNGEVR